MLPEKRKVYFPTAFAILVQGDIKISKGSAEKKKK